MAETTSTLPTIAITPLDADKREGDTGTTPFTFTVTRTGDTTGASTVDWVVYAIVASGVNPATIASPSSTVYPISTWFPSNVSQADFGGVFPSGTISFAAGETSTTLIIPVQGDTQAEMSEAFYVSLNNPVGAVLDSTKTRGSGIIRDDDSTVVSISESLANSILYSSSYGSGTSRREGDTGRPPPTYNVTRIGDISGTSLVSWSVTGSGTHPADAADFGGTLPSGTINFAAGEVYKSITVPVTDDTTVEPDETFTVTLGNPVGTSLGTSTADGIIVNDDALNPCHSLAITSGGVSREFEMEAYSGPVSGLQNMYVGADDGEAMRGSLFADFINTRGGDDAVDGSFGDDVLDGGQGSNFLTGGMGMDTFFVDGRGGGVTWSTVTDLEKGEWVTAWGWQEGVSKLTWAEMSGAEGSKGATAHIDLDANGSIDMSVTFAGVTSGALLVTPGQVNGSNYLAFTLS